MSTTDVVHATIVELESNPLSEWAKHRSRATKDMRRLLGTWFLTGKWYYFFLILSDTGYLMAREKYSAFAIDRIYVNSPEGRGWIGRIMDRYILNLPVHQAVRRRFEFVTRGATASVHERLAQGVQRVAVLSVPCGLLRDLCTIYKRAQIGHPDVARRLRFYGLDLDFEGQVLKEAQRRAQADGMPIQLVQANVLDPGAWSWLGEKETSFSLIICMGLAPWLNREELRALLKRFSAHLEMGGYVLLDRFNQSKHSRMGEKAEIHANYHTDEEYQEHIRASGLTLVGSEVLGEDEGKGYLLRKVG